MPPTPVAELGLWRAEEPPTVLFWLYRGPHAVSPVGDRNGGEVNETSDENEGDEDAEFEDDDGELGGYDEVQHLQLCDILDTNMRGTRSVAAYSDRGLPNYELINQLEEVDITRKSYSDSASEPVLGSDDKWRIWGSGSTQCRVRKRPPCFEGRHRSYFQAAPEFNFQVQQQSVRPELESRLAFRGTTSADETPSTAPTLTPVQPLYNAAPPDHLLHAERSSSSFSWICGDNEDSDFSGRPFSSNGKEPVSRNFPSRYSFRSKLSGSSCSWNSGTTGGCGSSTRSRRRRNFERCSGARYRSELKQASAAHLDFVRSTNIRCSSDLKHSCCGEVSNNSSGLIEGLNATQQVLAGPVDEHRQPLSSSSSLGLLIRHWSTAFCCGVPQCPPVLNERPMSPAAATQQPLHSTCPVTTASSPHGGCDAGRDWSANDLFRGLQLTLTHGASRVHKETRSVDLGSRREGYSLSPGDWTSRMLHPLLGPFVSLSREIIPVSGTCKLRIERLGATSNRVTRLASIRLSAQCYGRISNCSDRRATGATLAWCAALTALNPSEIPLEPQERHRTEIWPTAAADSRYLICRSSGSGFHKKSRYKIRYCQYRAASDKSIASLTRMNLCSGVNDEVSELNCGEPRDDDAKFNHDGSTWGLAVSRWRYVRDHLEGYRHSRDECLPAAAERGGESNLVEYSDRSSLGTHDSPMNVELPYADPRPFVAVATKGGTQHAVGGINSRGENTECGKHSSVCSKATLCGSRPSPCDLGVTTCMHNRPNSSSCHVVAEQYLGLPEGNAALPGVSFTTFEMMLRETARPQSCAALPGSVLSFFCRLSLPLCRTAADCCIVSLTEEERHSLPRLQERAQRPFDQFNPDHEALLERYWRTAFPGEQYDPGPTTSWVQLGFQGFNPRTDFRGGGLLSLEAMVYFSVHKSQEFRRILSECWALGGHRNVYPCSAAFINVAFLLITAFQLNSTTIRCVASDNRTAPRRALKRFAQLLTKYPNAFEEVFCYCCILLHENWRRLMVTPGITLLEFHRALKHTKTQLFHILGSW